MSSQNVKPPAPNGRGRPFRAGNPGRKPGSKNRTTLVAEALLKGEQVAIVRKAIELAENGNVPLLKLFVQSMLSKERAVCVDLPQIDCASDAVDAMGAIIHAVSIGEISPSEAAALAALVTACARTINIADLELRLDNIEKRLEEERLQGR